MNGPTEKISSCPVSPLTPVDVVFVLAFVTQSCCHFGLEKTVLKLKRSSWFDRKYYGQLITEQLSSEPCLPESDLNKEREREICTNCVSLKSIAVS